MGRLKIDGGRIQSCELEVGDLVHALARGPEGRSLPVASGGGKCKGASGAVGVPGRGLGRPSRSVPGLPCLYDPTQSASQ